MRSQFYLRRSSFCLLAALCILPCVGFSQGLSLPIPDRSKEWRRISTGQDSSTDVGVSSLLLEPKGILRATFRIALSKSEDAVEKPGAKYKTRLVTIQFDAWKKLYRIFETTLRDSSDKTVYESGPNSAATWRPIARSSSDYFTAALSLTPLGIWRVTSASDTETMTAEGGALTVATTMDRFEVGRNTCTTPNYESASMTRDEAAALTGLSANGIQPTAEKVNVVKITCDSPTPTSKIHFLILRSADRAILLSAGNLFALEK
jgi:hypothetical protein